MTSIHWTEAPKGAAHIPLIPYLENLKATYRDSRLIWWETFVGMYSDMQDVSLLPSRATAPMSPIVNKYAVPINVVAPLVDTAEARITSARPRPFFKTVGGSWSEQRKAKKLQKFADGIFDETKAYRIGAMALKDAALFGTGCVKIYSRGGKIKSERTLISNVLVDEALGFDMNPPELSEVQEVSRTKLMALAKDDDQKEAIRKLPSIASRAGAFWADLVEVYETWYLPQGDEPGRHVICIPGATLLDEAWDRDYFPIIFIRWRNSPTGFFGLGLAHQAMSAQVEITSMVRNISKNLHLFTNPRVIIPNNSAISPHHMTNAWGTVLQYKPPFKPELLSPPQIVPPEVYNWFENMYRKVFEMCGLSSQSAFAQKPPGLDSGKALREMSDIQSDRLAPISQRYEQFYLDFVTTCIDEASSMKENYSVVSVGKRSERLTWSDVKMPDDSYTIQLFAANFLSRTPSGIFQDVQDLLNMQLIDQVTARKLMDFPDLQQVFDDENAARDNFESQIEKILDDDLYFAPQPFDDLQLGTKVYRDAYNKARLDDVPESKQQMMRDWIEQAQAMTPPPAPPMPPMGGMMPPGGVPMPNHPMAGAM